MEYTTASITGLKPNEINDRINQYAKDGWELVVVSFNTCFFRRDLTMNAGINTVKGSTVNKDADKSRGTSGKTKQ